MKTKTLVLIGAGLVTSGVTVHFVAKALKKAQRKRELADLLKKWDKLTPEQQAAAMGDMTSAELEAFQNNLTPEQQAIVQKSTNPANTPFVNNVAYAKGETVNVRSGPEVNTNAVSTSEAIIGVLTFGLSLPLTRTLDKSNKIAEVKAGEKVGIIVGIETDTSKKAYRWFRVKNPDGIGGTEHKYGYVREDVVDVVKPVN